MGTSAWLLSKAALHPSIAALQVAIVGVRAFGVSRAALRYLERLVSHDVTLRLLGRLRMALFRALVPLSPARLLGHRRGDLLGRMLEDVGTLESLYVRVLGPSLAAIDQALAALLWRFSSALPVIAVSARLGDVVAPASAGWRGAGTPLHCAVSSWPGSSTAYGESPTSWRSGGRVPTRARSRRSPATS
jgi:ABC-type transport system involved in cytochrome bd biosynthesis fused ATPase/permease subunit